MKFKQFQTEEKLKLPPLSKVTTQSHKN